MKKLLFSFFLSVSAFAQQGIFPGTGSGSSLLSQKVVYTSRLVGIPASTAVVPGSSATGTTDAASLLNAAISAGNVDLEVDGGYALSTSLVIGSNTTIHCISQQYGFIMQTASNASVIVNAHQNSPTTASGTGGFLPSNIADNGITIRGCILNANSTQAVTGTNSQGTAHGATPGGKFTYGVFLGAVNDVTLDDNTIYDTGCFGTFFTNATQIWITNNYIQQPVPTVNRKFTDAMHIIGPAQFVYMEDNNLTSGDDAIALNADDGNRTGSGDVNASYVQAFVKWGPILDVHVDNTTLDYTDYGLRIYSATELVDRIFVSDTEGTSCGNTALVAALSAIGPGNIGKVRINGWTEQTDGTCNVFSLPYNFQIAANVQNLEIGGISISNPIINWPVLIQTAGQVNVLSLHDWSLNTTASTFSNVIALSGGTINQLQISGINWNDYVGTGSFLSGTAFPQNITCSSYFGPNRLLASGFTPGNTSGDCFSNTYPTPYVSTVFREASSGALAGTAPATLLNGASGTWTAAAGGPAGGGVWTYNASGQVVLSGPCSAGGTDNFCPVTINTGTPNYIWKANVAQFDCPATCSALPGLAFATRWTNNQNFVAFLPNGGSPGPTMTWGLYDVVANVTTQIGSSVALGEYPGLWTVTMNGTTATLVNPQGTKLTGTISGSGNGNNAATNVGLSSNITAFTQSDVISYFNLSAIPTTKPDAATGSTCGTVGTVTGSVANGIYTGTVVGGAVTTCTLKLTFGTAAPHGYVCSLHDQTTGADFNNFVQASNTTTSCTSNAATIVSGDTVLYQATPF